MEQATFIVGVLIIVILAAATFSYGGGFTLTSGPRATPPNPDAEFGVVHEQKTFFGSPVSPPASGGKTSPPPPTTSESQELLSKSFAVGTGNAKSNKPDQEYIQISYNPREGAPDAVNISNWTVSSARGESYRLGTVVNFPGISPTEIGSALVVKRGSRVNVVTGQSPLGISFQKNKCAPYFNQFHSFTPGLSASCPSPSKEPGQDAFSDTCFNFIKGLGSCRIPTSLPQNLDNQCRDYIARTASYNGCITSHKNDKDFYGNEWWVYLNRPTQVWSDIRDTITLRDDQGIAITSKSY